jgi:hypothetical protein
MALVYKAHFAAIGVFDDTPYIVRLLIVATDRPTQAFLLQLLSALVEQPSNADLVLEQSAIQLMCDLITLSHAENIEPAPLQRSDADNEDSNVKRQGPPCWYSLNEGLVSGLGVGEGPYRVADLKGSIEHREIHADTNVRCEGSDVTKGWKKITDTPQLRYQLLMTGHAIMSQVEVAKMCQVNKNVCVYICTQGCVRYVTRYVMVWY